LAHCLPHSYDPASSVSADGYPSPGT
jgi:hypothetical protein